MKKITVLLIGTMLGPVILLLSCSKDSGGGNNNFTVDCNTVNNKAFAADINPIIQSTCNTSGCHAAGSTNGPGAITNHGEVFTNRSAIRAAIANGSMPKNTSLSTAQKNSFICWIDSGAPNN